MAHALSLPHQLLVVINVQNESADMNTDEFVRLNESLGHNIIRTQNYAWILRGDKSALSLPTLEDVYPSKQELNKLFGLGVKAVFFKTNLPAKNCFEYVFSGEEYELNSFDSKIRNQIRKGLKDCTISEATENDMVENGFLINLQVLKKQHREVQYLDNKLKWKKYVATLMQHEDVFIKGAFVNSALIAYTIFLKVHEKYYIYHPFMDKKYSNSCPMNAIIYSFINEVLERERVIDISYGLSSYSEKHGLDKFKKGMLFKESQCTRVVAVNGILGVLINRKMHKLIKILVKINLVSEARLNQFCYLLDNKNILNEYLSFHMG